MISEQPHVGFRIQKLITNIMLLLNYSINFFFYCAFNQKFLDTLKLTFHYRLGPYFNVNSYHQNENQSPAIQRTLFNSTTSSANSSYYLQSKILNSSKKFSNYDDEFKRSKLQRRDFYLKTFENNNAKQ
jgi:hypothetical protein